MANIWNFRQLHKTLERTAWWLSTPIFADTFFVLLSCIFLTSRTRQTDLFVIFNLNYNIFVDVILKHAEAEHLMGMVENMQPAND